MTNIRLIMSSMNQQLRLSIGRNMFRFCVFVGPIISGFILGMMYMNRSSEDFTTYAVFGGGILSFWGSILFSSASDIERERYMGTLEILFGAPGELLTVFIGKVIGNTLWGCVSFFINIIFVIVIFDKSLDVAMPFLAIMALILMILSYMAIALLMAGLFTLSRNSRLVMNSLEHPIMLLCGVLVPLEVIPHYLHPLAWLLSPTWVSLVLRNAVIGVPFNDWFLQIMILLLLTCLYWIGCFLVFKRIDYRARVSATLGVY